MRSDSIPRRPGTDPAEVADIEFGCVVSAGELRFRSPPSTVVRFSGEPGRLATTSSRRTNLPDPVVAAVSYRRIRVEYGLRASVVGPASKNSD